MLNGKLTRNHNKNNYEYIFRIQYDLSNILLHILYRIKHSTSLCNNDYDDIYYIDLHFSFINVDDENTIEIMLYSDCCYHGDCTCLNSVCFKT